MSLGFPKKVEPNGGQKQEQQHNRITTIQPKPLPTIIPYGDNSIVVENLTYSYNRDSYSTTSTSTDNSNAVLKDLNLSLPTGSRCLLIGANGSGKSTLLRILAGRHMTHGTGSSVRVLGLNAFHDTKLNFHRAYLDCDWGMRNVAFVGGNVPLAADIPVYKMMETLQASYPERRDELIELLGININWRMHQLSDGQRRRVQIFLCLLRPFQILLLDEVTTSLDVCVRQDLLRWLIKESDERKATIIYATHIFDGLDDWSTHLFYLTNNGQCGWQGRQVDTIQIDTTSNGINNEQQQNPKSMLAIAEHWLRAELIENKKKRIVEKAQYASSQEQDAELYNPKSQGGYGSGRLAGVQLDQQQPQPSRQGRLSDIMGNAGTLNKVRRTVESSLTSTTSTGIPSSETAMEE